MLLLNYDFYDIHSVLTTLRAKPEKEYIIEIVKAVLEILSTSQIDNTIDDNIIRKKLRTIERIVKIILEFFCQHEPKGLSQVWESFPIVRRPIQKSPAIIHR